MQIGRKQLIFSFDSHHNRLTLRSEALNPSLVTQIRPLEDGTTKQKSTQKVSSQRAVPLEVQDGDIIHLLLDKYPYKLHWTPFSAAGAAPSTPQKEFKSKAEEEHPSKRSRMSSSSAALTPTKEPQKPLLPVLILPLVALPPSIHEETASNMIARILTSFLKRHASDNIRICIYEAGKSESCLAKVKRDLSDSSAKIAFFQGLPDLPNLKSAVSSLLSPSADEFEHKIVFTNADNNRELTPGLHSCAGPVLSTLTRKIDSDLIVPGYAFSVELPEDNEWRTNQSVSHIIEALGPTALFSKELLARGTSVLQTTYESILKRFEDILQPIKSKIRSPVSSAASSDLASSSSSSSSSAAPVLFSPYKHPGPSGIVRSGFWADALKVVANDPDKYPNVIYYMDEHVVVMYDAYAKSKVHLLCLPRHERADNISELRPSQVPLLQHMIEVARGIESHLTQTQFPKLVFKHGFHAIPSMRLLHLHIISQDFQSDAIKKKTHWNSFTTPFFVEAEQVLACLEQGSMFAVDEAEMKGYEDQDMICCWCNSSIKNIPNLKQHIKTCGSRPCK